VKISASKEGVKFQVAGDMGTGNIVCKANNSVDDEDDAVRQHTITCTTPQSSDTACHSIAQNLESVA
jgi:hypothetical protein